MAVNDFKPIPRGKPLDQMRAAIGTKDLQGQKFQVEEDAVTHDTIMTVQFIKSDNPAAIPTLGATRIQVQATIHNGKLLSWDVTPKLVGGDEKHKGVECQLDVGCKAFADQVTFAAGKAIAESLVLLAASLPKTPASPPASAAASSVPAAASSTSALKPAQGRIVNENGYPINVPITVRILDRVGGKVLTHVQSTVETSPAQNVFRDLSLNGLPQSVVIEVLAYGFIPRVEVVETKNLSGQPLSYKLFPERYREAVNLQPKTNKLTLQKSAQWPLGFQGDKLRAADEELVELLADGLRMQPKMKVEIQGYADGDQAKSLARAESIKRLLVKFGVAADRLTVKGDANKGKERIEFLVTAGLPAAAAPAAAPAKRGAAKEEEEI